MAKIKSDATFLEIDVNGINVTAKQRKAYATYKAAQAAAQAARQAFEGTFTEQQVMTFYDIITNGQGKVYSTQPSFFHNFGKLSVAFLPERNSRKTFKA
jgi:hypothetical protein